MEAKKVNCGQLEEIPEISVNEFSATLDTRHEKGISAYFLTHIDPDIVKDVLSLKFLTKMVECKLGTLRLFLHPMSFNYLVKWSTNSNDEDFQVASKILFRLQRAGRIILLEKDIPILLKFGIEGPEDEIIVVEFDKDALLVTPLSAGHNPGSIMLLFERKEIRILYTGNCRALLNDLRSSKPLHNPNGSPKEISILYIDTMYCLETVQEFPTREEVIAKIFKMIKNRINGNPRIRFEFWTKGRLGIEDYFSLVARSVYTSFRGNIQARPISYKQNSADENRDQCFLSFYAPFEFDMNSLCEIESLDEYDDQVYKLHLHCDMTENGEDDIQLNEHNKFLYSDSEETYKVHGIYAAHLSRFEMGRFINYFQLDSSHVRPLYENKGMGASEMESLIKSTCAIVFDQEPKNLLQEKPSSFYDFTDLTESEKSLPKKPHAPPQESADSEEEIIVIPFYK